MKGFRRALKTSLCSVSGNRILCSGDLMSSALLWSRLCCRRPVPSGPLHLFLPPSELPSALQIFMNAPYLAYALFSRLIIFRSQTTCLMLAAKRGYAKVINLLMSFGAEINAQDKYGYTVSPCIPFVYCF